MRCDELEMRPCGTWNNQERVIHFVGEFYSGLFSFIIITEEVLLGIVGFDLGMLFLYKDFF